MERARVTIVRLKSERQSFDRTFVVSHCADLDPGAVFSSLVEQAPEMKVRSDLSATRLHAAMVEAYPNRLKAWETSKAICENYENYLHDYEQKLLEYDELKMSGKVVEMGKVLTEPGRPSAEHYPLPPMPEDPGELELLPFDGSFRDCVEFVQGSDLERCGLHVLFVEDHVGHIQIVHG